MMDVGRHPNVNLYTYSEVEDVTGYIGNFNVKIRKKARFVGYPQDFKLSKYPLRYVK